ncbi:hypothetical protein CVIRNUC_010485 [Coccomyxa viridis]|uniref:Uncharacterized protein n=1 Tax=Coccomyxa viridis TaxID=1274662 RepID=A0AAV1IKQ1_9CHLO|nr:hypothetical protein CVIRNUC_010485 [Coccomyxa viridis]
MQSTHGDQSGSLPDTKAASVQGAVHAQPQIRWAETWQRSAREQPAVDLLSLGAAATDKASRMTKRVPRRPYG